MLHPDSGSSHSNNNAATLGVWIGLQYEVMSATNSSPQTTEINAHTRAASLMKWVHLGVAQGIGLMFIGIASEPPGKRWRPFVGSVVGAGLMYAQYRYALACGLRNIEDPPTEAPMTPDNGNPNW